MPAHLRLAGCVLAAVLAAASMAGVGAEDGLSVSEALVTNQTDDTLSFVDLATLKAAEPVKTQARSGTGAGRTVGLRTTYKAEILNWAFAIKHFGDAPEVREVVQRLADAEARRQKEALAIPGVRVITTQGV